MATHPTGKQKSSVLRVGTSRSGIVGKLVRSRVRMAGIGLDWPRKNAGGGFRDGMPDLGGLRKRIGRGIAIYQCLLCDGRGRRHRQKAIVGLLSFKLQALKMALMALGQYTDSDDAGPAKVTTLTNGPLNARTLPSQG